jgi:chromate transporter
MMLYVKLFVEFFRAGLFSIGGGLATLPFLNDMMNRLGWFTQTELTNMIAIAESTPGPIGVNMSTYVGYHTAGILGALTATIALVMPSVIVMLIIVHILERFRQNRYVNAALEVLRPASVGLVAAAVLSVLKVVLLNTDAISAGSWGSALNLPAFVLFAVMSVFYYRHDKLHPLFLIAAGAIIGIFFPL